MTERSETPYTVASAKRERVRSHLLALIEVGAAGQSIPSERQLCEQLEVSRPTLRAVVDDLVQAGTLVRHQGKGVFIARAKIAQHLVELSGTNSHVATSVDGAWSSRTLSFEVVPAGARVGRRLQLAPHEPIVRVHRVRLVDNEPVCVEKIHLPRSTVPELSRADLDGVSLYALLRQRFEVPLGKAVQIIEPTVTDAEEAALLEVPAQSPALLFERTTKDELGRTVEFTHSIYRGDRYRIVCSLELNAGVEPGRQSVLVGQWSPTTGLSGALTPDPDWSSGAMSGPA